MTVIFNPDPLTWLSVWDIPLDATPRNLADAVETLWAVGEDSDERCLAFDIAAGLHWHCAEWHGGQWSERYSILSTLGYKPGAGENAPPEEGDEEDREAETYIYQMLNRSAEIESKPAQPPWGARGRHPHTESGADER